MLALWDTCIKWLQAGHTGMTWSRRCFSIKKVLFPAEEGVKSGLKHCNSDTGNGQPCSSMRGSHQGGIWSLGWENPLEKEMANTHSGIPAWEIPWTEESGGLQSMGSQRVGTWLITQTCTKIQAVNEKERTSILLSLKSHRDPAWVNGGWREKVKAEKTDPKAEDHRKTWVISQLAQPVNQSDCSKWNRFQGDEESGGTLQTISQQLKPKIRQPQHSENIYRKRECSYQLFH